jgi:hypothetical protein
MGEPAYDAAYYRKQANEARQSSASAISPEFRVGYLVLAEKWDRVARDAAATGFGCSSTKRNQR